MAIILAVVAHPDDEVIGLGGTLAKHVKQGDRVYVLIMAAQTTSRDAADKPPGPETAAALALLGIEDHVNEQLPDNRFDTLPMLDIIKRISNRIKDSQPSIVYTHHWGDLNIDHKIISDATITACRPIENQCVSEIRMFETLSSTEMAGFTPNTTFHPNLFIDISAELDQKLQSMRCYQSELQEYPHPRSLKAIEANAIVWGVKNNLPAAEAFYLFRCIKLSA